MVSGRPAHPNASSIRSMRASLVPPHTQACGRAAAAGRPQCSVAGLQPGEPAFEGARWLETWNVERTAFSLLRAARAVLQGSRQVQTMSTAVTRSRAGPERVASSRRPSRCGRRAGHICAPLRSPFASGTVGVETQRWRSGDARFGKRAGPGPGSRIRMLQPRAHALYGCGYTNDQASMRPPL